jgi:L-lactate dehydrogenase complex protein LldG
MTSGTESRKNILARIYAATPGSAANSDQASDTYRTLPRTYIRRGGLAVDDCLALMVDRLLDYDAEVVQCSAQNLPAIIAAKLEASGRRIFAAPPGLPSEWLVAGFDWRIDRNLKVEDIEAVEGVVTACFCGVADSGTIVLHHSDTEGRRFLTLLPDWHLCILRASQVVETLPEYFDRCAQPPALATWISGPSATADIEMTRIKGVHGPRHLQVIVVDDR